MLRICASIFLFVALTASSSAQMDSCLEQTRQALTPCFGLEAGKGLFQIALRYEDDKRARRADVAPRQDC